MDPSFPFLLGSSVLGTEDDLAVSLRFMNFGSSPPSSDEDSGLSSFVENPQYFCGIIKDKDMCEWQVPLQSFTTLELFPVKVILKAQFEI